MVSDGHGDCMQLARTNVMVDIEKESNKEWGW